MNALNIILALPGGASIALIAIAILLLFGGRKIPELMKGLGGGIKEFKKASKEDDDEPEVIDKKKK
ncbi:hypothetical protein GCM10011416_08050 [Polaribacter pacificus]|uniref:Sec-independent protein translocase protein TatA n=1 Tax=Polaribacter pacificus TaxID=1775173 RepID=A0A917MCG8_9FLAO|nr:twin-arginine translocase TatA/TatE family subunit [Polaribacter pacificus]GGG93333.1 hypothetical protein GCM10011416_08050 [Polaribacter pacificus]